MCKNDRKRETFQCGQERELEKRVALPYPSPEVTFEVTELIQKFLLIFLSRPLTLRDQRNSLLLKKITCL